MYIVEDDSNGTFQVFCDFDSEPGLAWNLIESFSLSNKNLFQVTFLSEIIAYKATPLFQRWGRGAGDRE